MIIDKDALPKGIFIFGRYVSTPIAAVGRLTTRTSPGPVFDTWFFEKLSAMGDSIEDGSKRPIQEILLPYHPALHSTIALSLHLPD